MDIKVTKGEASYIARALTLLRSDLKQEIKEHGDEDGANDAHVRILDRIIPKFLVFFDKADEQERKLAERDLKDEACTISSMHKILERSSKNEDRT